MSLNDPQWGKRGNNSGPPDLDEIWRNLSRRFNELFGRKAGGGSDGGGDPGDGGRGRKFPLSGAGIVVALVLFVWLASGVYIVDEGRRGVVTRFGKYTETTQAGARWHLPFPIEAVQLVDFSQSRRVEVGFRGNSKNKKANEAPMLTDDENIIDVLFTVQYNLNNAEAYAFNVRNPDQIVQFVAQTAMGEVVGKAKMDFVLYEGGEQIAKSAEKLMQEMLDRYEAGIFIQKVALQSVQPPDKVQAAFDDAVKAGQDRDRFRNEGPGLRERRRSARPRQRGAAPRGSERLSRVRRAAGRRRRVALPADPHRIHEGARRHARAPLHRHDADGAREHEQGPRRPESGQQPPLPAARQADPAKRSRHRRAVDHARPVGLASVDRAGAGSLGHARPVARARSPAQPRPPRGNAMKFTMPILALVVALLLVASQALYTVHQTQYAIKFQLGEIVETQSTAGLYTKWPLLQNVKFYDRRTLVLDNPEPDRITTSEKKPLLIDFFVLWRITDVKQFYVNTQQGDEDVARQRLSTTVRANLREEINKRTVHEVISSERDKIMATTRQKADTDAKTFGVEIVDVRLRRVELPPDVTDPVYARMESERRRVANELRSLGQAESEKVRADADRQREVIIAEAYRQAQQIKGQGDAKAAAIYAAAFGANPEFFAFYRSLEAYRATFRGRNDVMVLDPGSDFFRYFRGPGGQGAKAPK